MKGSNSFFNIINQKIETKAMGISLKNSKMPNPV